MAAIAIEKGIPLPSDSRGRKDKYPYRQMEVGDSFFVPDLGRKNIHAAPCERGRALGCKFVARRVDGGYRVWRTK